MIGGNTWHVSGGRVLGPAPFLVAGIVNVTPDSFFDGGRFLNPDAALDQGRHLAAAGAHILDVGGESTRPGAASVAEAEELVGATAATWSFNRRSKLVSQPGPNFSSRCGGRYGIAGKAGVHQVGAADIVENLGEDLVAVSAVFGKEIPAEARHRRTREPLEVAVELLVALDIGIIVGRALRIPALEEITVGIGAEILAQGRAEGDEPIVGRRAGG